MTSPSATPGAESVKRPALIRRECAYRAYATDEQRSSAARMLRDFPARAAMAAKTFVDASGFYALLKPAAAAPETPP